MAEMNTLPTVTAKNYFDPDIEMAYMGSTQVKNFMRCEAAELARLKGEYRSAATTAMLVGSYVDAHFEGSLDVFQAQHPELFKRDGTLKAEFSHANDIISRMEADELYSLLMSGQKQVIRTGEIAGVPFKVKIDSLLDRDTCAEIVRRFPETASVMGLCDGAIVDQKVMRDLEDVWDGTERAYVPFWRAWGYDVQGAIYQAVEGHLWPFLLAVGTKEDEPDLQALHIRDEVLAPKLAEIEDAVPRFQAIKAGREAPRRCEHCAYCRATRKLTRIIDAEELEAPYGEAED